MVEHWSEKPGVDSSILSLGIFFASAFEFGIRFRGLNYLFAHAHCRGSPRPLRSRPNSKSSQKICLLFNQRKRSLEFAQISLFCVWRAVGARAKKSKNATIYLIKRPIYIPNGFYMSITIEEIRKIAKLAKMEITDKEAEAYARQLGNVLDWVEELKRVDTSSPNAVYEQAAAKTHDDTPVIFENADKITRAFSEKENSLLKVKKVL